MARATPEWIGKHPDSAIPVRVRLRVFERHGGVCHVSGRRIAAGEPWECDHVVALINGGTHSEDNLAPALRDKHREKTAADVAEKAAVAKTKARNLGISRPKGLIKSAGFAKSPRQNPTRIPDKLKHLPRKWCD
jgi:5-methylcytosine-specific restriction enzyme A